ncbi:MAG: hypothetical protein RRZ93_03600, partial [Ruthenibacterium sp.]
MRQIKHAPAARNQRQTVRLVQRILHCHGKQIIALLAKGSTQQRRARNVIYCIPMGDLLRQRRARFSVSSLK